ncbi:MAG: alcohol dehydrogenase catalytic domain-containing protein [Bryobacteraceae bacterium]
MLVAELSAQRKFRLTEQTPPEPGPGEVQARVHAVGVCGSDLHNFSEGSIGDTVCTYPVILGHEPTGVITKLGTGVTGWSVGDRVALEPAIYCYHCEFCITGRHNVCQTVRFMSTPPDAGYFREYVTLPAVNLLPLPGNLSFGEGSLFEPLAVALHSMKFVQLEPMETVAVFGAGPIGLLTIACLRMAGASRIYAVDPVAARRDLALQLGADVAIDPLKIEPARFILGDTGQRGVDATVDCAAKEDSMNQCIHATRNAGRVVVTGIPSEVKIALEFHPMRRKELKFFNVRRSSHESETALQVLKERPQLFAPMLTHTMPLDNVQGAFELLEGYGDGVGKIVIACC